LLEQIRQSRKPIVGLGPRQELNSEIDIAIKTGLTSADGAEQGELADTQAADLPLNSSDAATACSRVNGLTCFPKTDPP
jgi:hypothetical protein